MATYLIVRSATCRPQFDSSQRTGTWALERRLPHHGKYVF